MFAPVLLFLSLLPAQMGQGLKIADPNKDFAETKEKVYGVMPPELVAAPHVADASWSASGKWLLANRLDAQVSKKMMESVVMGTPAPPPSADYVLLVWNADSRRSHELLKLPAIGSDIKTAAWMPGTDRALVLVHEMLDFTEGKPGKERWTLYSSSAGSQLEQMFRSEDSGETTSSIWLTMSPTKPLAFVSLPHFSPPSAAGGPKRDLSIHLVNASGSAQQIKLPEHQHVNGMFDEKGDPILQVFPKSFPGEQVQPTYFAVSQHGSATRLDKAPSLAQHEQPKLGNDFLKIEGDLQTSKVGSRSVPIGSLWLSGAKDAESSAFVAGAVEGAMPSPTMSEIAYIQSGTLFVRGVVALPRKAAEEARNAAKRSELLTRVKQVGLAAIMYASDHDDVFPGKDVNELFMPYLKNSSMLAQFVWTYPGGPMNDIRAPAETELGFIPGPGGRAVVYADGHAKWVPDK